MAMEAKASGRRNRHRLMFHCAVCLNSSDCVCLGSNCCYNNKDKGFSLGRHSTTSSRWVRRMEAGQKRVEQLNQPVAIATVTGTTSLETSDKQASQKSLDVFSFPTPVNI